MNKTILPGIVNLPACRSRFGNGRWLIFLRKSSGMNFHDESI
jgi:hypothetical protein